MFGVPFRHLPIPSKEEGGKRVQEIQVQQKSKSNLFPRSLVLCSFYCVTVGHGNTIVFYSLVKLTHDTDVEAW